MDSPTINQQEPLPINVASQSAHQIITKKTSFLSLPNWVPKIPYKYLAIVEILFSLLNLVLYLNALLRVDSIATVPFEAIASIVGIVGGSLILLNIKTGIIVSKIWTVLLIPIIQFVTSTYAIKISFSIVTLNYFFNLSDKSWQFIFGTNFIGLLLFALFLRGRDNKPFPETVPNPPVIS